MTESLYDYILETGIRESRLLQQLREKTHQRPDAVMQIAPEQGQLMNLLVKLTNAKKIIEIGVFTGYSSLAMATALPSEGYILACDINEETTTIARNFWKQAEVADKINLQLGPALETLKQALADNQQESFDLAFIDADKTPYDQYYEYSLKLLRQGGLIILDNTLQSGRVADSKYHDEDTEALKQLNLKIKHDERVDMVLLPIADGITLVRKR
ncbi:class I SAM-dependent methyltransferase [Endozoicomonas sp. Mp262]|uniref:class I SAM-dependent methyltransferase n=1 Tax=Endozoicomonas sp. Mp262 TaxID=2919499 RepID=UPI0021DB11D7